MHGRIFIFIGNHKVGSVDRGMVGSRVDRARDPPKSYDSTDRLNKKNLVKNSL
jgi:hypothetical protein